MAVVCSNCRGTGEDQMVYEPFWGRKPRQGVARVNPGVVITPEVTNGGVSYETWRQNQESVEQTGREVREHFCPTRTGNPHGRSARTSPTSRSAPCSARRMSAGNGSTTNRNRPGWKTPKRKNQRRNHDARLPE